MEINTNIDKDKWNITEILNLCAVDLDGDGKPDALAVCNPDGTPVNYLQSPNGTLWKILVDNNGNLSTEAIPESGESG